MAKETRNTSLTLKCKNDWHFVSHDSLICMTPTPHLSFFTANGLFWTKQCKSVDLLWLLAALACNIIPSFCLFLSYNMHINMHTNTASFGPLWAVWSLCSPPAFLSGSPFLSPWSHWSTGALPAWLYSVWLGTAARCGRASAYPLQLGYPLEGVSQTDDAHIFSWWRNALILSHCEVVVNQLLFDCSHYGWDLYLCTLCTG